MFWVTNVPQHDDSFSRWLLEGPQYTRPAEFRGWKVPDVLLSGNHAEDRSLAEKSKRSGERAKAARIC